MTFCNASSVIELGQFIIEYVGEVITTEEYERRCKDMRDRHKKNYYFLYLDSKRLIDAGPSGNLSRFINHSCEPNCELQKWKVIGDSRVGIFALTDLEPGDELLFNYGPKTFEFKDSCRCGSESCYINISIEPKTSSVCQDAFTTNSRL
ncbi:uncharacterized protein LOC129218334 [Uloborus diversus]|uniref:uncharacterized protein LOC129218334 n=1 Tax=Uloborus diversus TaxID=327109 RepID=UPI00240A7B03|nr:uncharacterized protein LOC129218334 [Uloborus diversus]